MSSPSRDREERLLTLYADAHYYFSEPTPRPLHHRFDKGSYVYLYRSGRERRGRLEIANHAGKPEQDAFTGYLDSTKISQSYKHPTLCTVTVDGYRAKAGPPANPISQSDNHHWRLPSTDPRDEGKFLFRLHTIDLYFWTVQDAQTFLAAAQKIMQQEQLDIEAAVVPEPQIQKMSPVVQKLENVAITDPAYHNGQTRNSRTVSIPTGPSPGATGPPQRPISRNEVPAKEESANFTPLAYNPAAPPAPEVIKHREKTPPPPEAVAGTGLAAAAYHDHVQATRPPTQPAYGPPPHGNLPYSPAPGGVQSQQTYPGSSPTNGSSRYGATSPSVPYTSSPSSATQGKRASSVSSLPPPPPKSAASTHNPYFSPSGAPFFAPPTTQANTGLPGPPPHNPNAHLMNSGTTPMESPATQILGETYIAGPQQPLQHLQPHYADYLSSRPQQPQPVGAYSDYKYDRPSRHHHHGHDEDYSIHSQVYRPTEDEASSHGKHRPSGAGPGQQPGKLEARAERAEKGVNRFLRKLENKLG
ncbi:hypothetical protein MMC13_000532 [Lambiella insularis]|nr:hypothetical protein [Lambiella insularis]